MRLLLAIALVALPAAGLAAEDRYGPPPPRRAPVVYPTPASAAAASAAVSQDAAAYNGRFLSWSSKGGARAAPTMQARQEPVQQPAAAQPQRLAMRPPQPLPQSLYSSPPPTAAPARAMAYVAPQRQRYVAPTVTPRPAPPPPAMAYVAPPRQPYVASPKPAPALAYAAPQRQPYVTPPQPAPAVASAVPQRQRSMEPVPLAAPADLPPPATYAGVPKNEPWRRFDVPKAERDRAAASAETASVTPPRPTVAVANAAIPPAAAPAAKPAPPKAEMALAAAKPAMKPAAAPALAPTQVAVAAPPPIPQTPSAPVKVRFYSLHREYGDTPDAITLPASRPPVLIGPSQAASAPVDGGDSSAGEGADQPAHKPAAQTGGLY